MRGLPDCCFIDCFDVCCLISCLVLFEFGLCFDVGWSDCIVVVLLLRLNSMVCWLVFVLIKYVLFGYCL